MYVCMYVWSALSAEYGSIEYRCQSGSWSFAEEKVALFLSSFDSKNFASRDKFGDPVSPQTPAHPQQSRLNVVLMYRIPPDELLFFAYSFVCFVDQTAPAVESRACVRRKNLAIHCKM